MFGSHPAGVGVPVGPDPVRVTCPTCGTSVVTKVKKRHGKWAWVSCCVLCFMGCFLGCCLIPFCIKAFNYIEHRCPQCNSYIGRYEG